MSTENHEPHQATVKKVDKLSPTRVRLHIEMSSTVVSKSEFSKTQAYARHAALPGFRPGKVPLQLVKQRFKDDIHRDVVSHLLRTGFGDALASTKLNPLNQPTIEIKPPDFEKGGPLEFSAEFEVSPQIDLKDYKGIKINQGKTEPTTEEVTKAIDGLRERMATLEPTPATSVEKGQFAIIELSYELVGDPKIAQEKKQSTVEAGVGNLIPDIDNAILELQCGDEKTMTATFPNDYSEKSHAGRTGNFTLRLVEVKKKVLPEPNDEFASQLKEGLTFEKLKEELVTTIRENKTKASEKAKRDQILRHLVEKNNFEAPLSLIENQSKNLVESIHEDMRAQGFKNPPELTDADKDNIRTHAEFLVRGSLLLQEIASKENLKLDETKLSERIQSIATSWNRSVKETQKMLDGKGMIDSVKNEILTDQVFEFLVQNAVLGN